MPENQYLLKNIGMQHFFILLWPRRELNLDEDSRFLSCDQGLSSKKSWKQIDDCKMKLVNAWKHIWRDLKPNSKKNHCWQNDFLEKIREIDGSIIQAIGCRDYQG